MGERVGGDLVREGEATLWVRSPRGTWYVREESQECAPLDFSRQTHHSRYLRILGQCVTTKLYAVIASFDSIQGVQKYDYSKKMSPFPTRAQDAQSHLPSPSFRLGAWTSTLFFWNLSLNRLLLSLSSSPPPSSFPPRMGGGYQRITYCAKE